MIRRNRIVAVCATAGSGKTTLVSQSSQLLDLPVCWLSVDSTEAAAGKFLTYLEAALSTQLSTVNGFVTAAARTGLSHSEVAGLLADAIGDTPLQLVLDNVERVAASAETLNVLETFLKYAPSTTRTVLVSRQELLFPDSANFNLTWLPVLGEDDLAFTVDEAAAALALTNSPHIDPEHAVAVTGGWVTGVLFEAWRSVDHASGLGGEADPLHGYLATHILAQLTPDERDFLISTALLDEVTPAAAEALGIADPTTVLHNLRHKRLPGCWDCRELALRCHPRFREYLLARLTRTDAARLKPLRHAHARLLRSQNHLEEAVEEFLEAGALDDAIEVAEQVIDAVIERADFSVAERWLRQLDEIRHPEHIALTGAELMLAIAREDYRRGVHVADRLWAAGLRDTVARSSSKLASMMAWCYLHAGRIDDIRSVLKIGKSGVELEAVRYCMTLVEDAGECRTASALSGGPLDALIMRVHYYHGKLPQLLELPTSPWAVKAAESWRLGALLAMGHVKQAADLYHALCRQQDPGVWLYSLFSVELLRQLSEPDGAWRALLKGRERLRTSGSVMLEMLSYVEEAALELRFNKDTASARAALERVQTHPVGRTYAFVAEQAATWLGYALLLDGDDFAAVEALRRAVSGMHDGKRALLLPIAAIYLAEAEWRLGNEDRADRATDLALAAAEGQQSNHLLLEALADFPLVLSRRLDAEPSAESSWHAVGRALMSRGVRLPAPRTIAIHLTEFGRIAIIVNGQEVRPRIKKSYELLAFLADHRHHQATKSELLEALFDGRHDDSAHAYLRQALYKLRHVLPDSTIEADASHVRMNDHVALTSDSENLRCLVAQSASLRGSDRLRSLDSALALLDRGEYLEGLESSWIDRRREELTVLALDTQSHAAELAFVVGDFQRAHDLACRVLDADAFRESLWRLKMRIADATGDGDGVIAGYRACERALHQLGTRPAATTRRLLHDLRR